MKTQIIKLLGLLFIFGYALSTNAEQMISQEMSSQKENMQWERRAGYFLEDAPAPLGMASYVFYQSQMAKSQHLQRLRKPMTTWLLLRVIPPQLPAYQIKPLWLLGFMIVVLPGIILRTLYKKNV